jgi:hypothetical protein
MEPMRFLVEVRINPAPDQDLQDAMAYWVVKAALEHVVKKRLRDYEWDAKITVEDADDRPD